MFLVLTVFIHFEGTRGKDNYATRKHFAELLELPFWDKYVAILEGCLDWLGVTIFPP
ncbi:MAG: hypothetical protein R2865_14555 [Deinococcales bacterium]